MKHVLVNQKRECDTHSETLENINHAVQGDKIPDVCRSHYILLHHVMCVFKL